MTNLFNPVKLGLENMDQLHKALGSPMDKSDISIIHIAGSNGKGSVALKTANALQLAGYKVGLFVSPHISSFRERIQINGQPISESQVEKYLQEIFDICEGEEIPATFFEVTTALAFHIFGQEKVDVVVLETGLGGRLDATNVISKPALSIITSIGLEHTRILGDTIELIAGEKAGIIKKDCPVLIGKNAPFDVLERCAREKGASEVYQSDDLLGPDPKEGEEVGDYDAENSRIASAGLILLQFHMAQQSIDAGKQPKIMTPAEIEEGVKIRPPCRFEEMDITTPVETDDGITTQKTVRVILDVAHNPQAMDYLLAKLRSNYPHSKDQRIVVGMSADKDLKYCTDILLEHLSNPNKLHLVEASHPRAASISSILEANPKLKESCYSQPQKDELNEAGRDASSVATQVKQALKLAAINNELLVICGSVFIMADAREELGIVEPRDSAVISEVAGAGLRSSQENFGDKK
ncbi:folylpolyglutamate synthase [Thalassiosira pseudonana CCMP1335]|uniref:Folylpolyglutamate synthase n=1 Tax=Thalassiosira pseudonana TaxID=35128 RepID=B8CBL4_THAPS|nr:folylpolyglutamate synthase [Thalassiosira pseudonana CCMP1335]EED89337.1 folylpolyglutamate synthase [Thalassiosira pseudonana CCMP1335]